MLGEDVHDWSALDQGRALRAGQFTCVELTGHHLARTHRLNDAIGAFAYVADEQALAQAAEIDRVLAAGEAPEGSPLFGCVAPVKDLDLVAGMPCEFGSQSMRGFVAPADAAFVTRMRAAGLVITGKTTTPEFGLPAYTENDLGHTARTPWDTGRSAGGSSGGAAAAVAARLSPLAQGSDGGGSIRIPASVTGLVGIKPSRGRVSGLPFPPGLGELAVIGPLARTVADAAAFLDVLAGSDDADIFGLPTPPPGFFLAAAQRMPERLRIGRFTTPMVADTEVDPDALAAVDITTDLLSAMGHEVVDIEPPVRVDTVPAFEVVWEVGAAALPIPDGAPLTALTRHLRALGASRSGVDVADAIRQMREVTARALAVTADLDVLLSPTLARLPMPVGHFAGRDPVDNFEEQKRFTPFTAPFNVTGQPAMSVPVHHTEVGLPVGIQLVGRPHDEATIISLAAQLEQQVPWHRRIPQGLA